jgi:malate dehydrogenase (oxaloacetate-decarboxylating)(NADP+)
MSTYIEVPAVTGITPDAARTMVRTNATVIAALAVIRGDADAMICGLEGRFESHLRNVATSSARPGQGHDLSAIDADLRRGDVPDRHLCDRRSDGRRDRRDDAAGGRPHPPLRHQPKAALLSHSNFGSRDNRPSAKMRRAAEILGASRPISNRRRNAWRLRAFGDAAPASMPHSKLKGEANLLVFPNLDAANITMTVVKVMTDALHVGPILLGAAKPAHILTPSVTSRGIVNMTALAAVEAQNV